MSVLLAVFPTKFHLFIYCLFWQTLFAVINCNRILIEELVLIVLATRKIHSSSHIALTHYITLPIISAMHTLVCSQFTHSPITTYVTIQHSLSCVPHKLFQTNRKYPYHQTTTTKSPSAQNGKVVCRVCLKTMELVRKLPHCNMWTSRWDEAHIQHQES